MQQPLLRYLRTCTSNDATKDKVQDAKTFSTVLPTPGRSEAHCVAQDTHY